MTARTGTASRRSVVVVTGAAGLIGSHVAAALTARGVGVLGVDLSVPDHRTSSGWLEAIKVDVTDEITVRRAARAVRETHGDIDALVHAAALTGRSGELRPDTLRTVDLRMWRRTLETNLTGALICAREFSAIMSAEEPGLILLVGSIQGLVPTMGSPSYAVSKAALVGLTRQLAAELSADAVRVNLVALGPVAESDAASSSVPEGGAPTPLGRLGRPGEIGDAIADLVMASSGFMTGAIIPVDGGEHLRPRVPPVIPGHPQGRTDEPSAGAPTAKDT